MSASKNYSFVYFIINNPIKSIFSSLMMCFLLISVVRYIQADFSYRAFFSEGNPLRVEIEGFEREFSNDDSIVLLVKSPSGIFDKETSELIVKLTEEMWQVPDVIRVDSLSNYRWVHASGDDIVLIQS